MKQTKPANLTVAAVLASVAGFLFTQSSIANGFAFISTHPTLVLTLPIAAIASYLLTRPLVRYRKELDKYLSGENNVRPFPINPFYAVRVLALAKSVSIAGAIFIGWHLGSLIYWLWVNPGSFLVLNVSGVLGGIMMVVAGIVGERNCRTPDNDSGNQEGVA